MLVHTDHATLRWILARPHLTVQQMDILTILQNVDWEVKHIPGANDQVANPLSRRPDFQRELCNAMAQDVMVARELIEDIKVGIIDDEWLGPIAHSLANSSPRPLPATASAKECKLWVSAQQFDLDENGLLRLRGDLEKKQAEENARAKKKDDEEVGTTVRTQEKEEDGRADKEEEKKTEKRGRLCIPKTMQRRILDDARDTPARGRCSADQIY